MSPWIQKRSSGEEKKYKRSRVDDYTTPIASLLFSYLPNWLDPLEHVESSNKRHQSIRNMQGQHILWFGLDQYYQALVPGMHNKCRVVTNQWQHCTWLCQMLCPKGALGRKKKRKGKCLHICSINTSVIIDQTNRTPTTMEPIKHTSPKAPYDFAGWMNSAATCAKMMPYSARSRIGSTSKRAKRIVTARSAFRIRFTMGQVKDSHIPRIRSRIVCNGRMCPDAGEKWKLNWVTNASLLMVSYMCRCCLILRIVIYEWGMWRICKVCEYFQVETSTHKKKESVNKGRKWEKVKEEPQIKLCLSPKRVKPPRKPPIFLLLPFRQYKYRPFNTT